MTRRLGVGRRGAVALGTVSLAFALACGAEVTGCGSSSGTGNPEDSGTDAFGTDSGPLADTAPPPDSTVPPPDTGTQPDTSMADTAPNLTPLAAPVFNPPSGTANPGTVTITEPGAPDGGGGVFILYTTDGTLPTRSSMSYSGPIQVSMGETIHAFAIGMGFSDSPIAMATYTVTPVEAGSLMAPVFTPPSSTFNNNFQLAVNSSAGATICYTTDGATTPTCNANGACTGTSSTYSATNQIQITGSVTNAATGVVSVQAIACQAGFNSTAVVTQQYTLQVATPTMIIAGAPTPLLQKAAGYTPTVSTTTNGSTIRYTTNGVAPTCITGTLVTNPYTFGGAGDALKSNTTYQVIACETGFAPSAVATIPFTIQLNPPGFPSAGTLGVPGIYDGPLAAFNLVEANTGAAAEWECITLDGSAPGCGTTQSACTSTPAAGVAAPGSAAITTTGTTLKAVACALGYNASAAASGLYTLQLDPPQLIPPGVVAATGVPKTTYAIPANMVGTLQVKVAQATPVGNLGTPALYAFACILKGAAPSCGNGACATGNEVMGPFPAGGVNAITLPAPAIGDSWSAIGCPADASILASTVTPVGFQATGAASQPTISPASGNYPSTVTPILTNTDPNAVNVCYTTNGTAATCSVTTGCGAQASLALPGVGSAAANVSAVNVTAGGSGFTSPPAVNFAGGGPTTGATAHAVLTAGVVTSIVVDTPGAGYSSVPTVTISGNGGIGAQAVATLTTSHAIATTFQVNGSSTLSAVACNASEPAGTPVPATYTFTLAQPDFGNNGVSNNLDAPATVGAGTTIQISTTSNFAGEKVYWTTGAAAVSCGVANNGAPPQTVTVPNNATTFTLNAIACASNTTNQTTSAARSVTFNVGTAMPTITTTQVVSGVPQTPWQNTVPNVTINTVTPGATLCYSTNGVVPACSAGACTAGTMAPGVNINLGTISTSATTVQAVACSATLAQSGLASQLFTLNVSQVVTTVPAATPNACPTSTRLQLDQGVGSTNQGGPTHNATVCYTSDGSTPVCGGGGTITCFGTGAGGAATSALITLSATSSIKTVTCSPMNTGFIGGSQSFPYNFTGYVHPPPTIVVDGNLGDWSVANEQVVAYQSNDTATTAARGYFTYDATNVYIAVQYNGVVAGGPGTMLGVYIGNGAGNGAIKDLPVFGLLGGAIPRNIRAAAGIQYAFQWQSDNAVAAGTFAWNAPMTQWVAANFTVTRAYDAATHTAEFSIPLSALAFDGAPPTTLTMAASMVSGIGTTTTTENFRFPGGLGGTGGALDLTDFFDDKLGSCLVPNAQLITYP